MWRILQLDVPEDFVIATSEAMALVDFVEEAFACVGLDWRDHVYEDTSLQRPTDVQFSRGNRRKAEAKLGWRAGTRGKSVVAKLMDAELSAGNADVSRSWLPVWDELEPAAE